MLRARFLSAKFVAHFLASSAFVIPTFSYVLYFKQPPSCRSGIEKSPREKPVGKAKCRQERALLPIPPQHLAALISDKKDVYCSFLWELDRLRIPKNKEKYCGDKDNFMYIFFRGQKKFMIISNVYKEW